MRKSDEVKIITADVFFYCICHHQLLSSKDRITTTIIIFIQNYKPFIKWHRIKSNSRTRNVIALLTILKIITDQASHLFLHSCNVSNQDLKKNFLYLCNIFPVKMICLQVHCNIFRNSFKFFHSPPY
jgi:hypothetical protein